MNKDEFFEEETTLKNIIEKYKNVIEYYNLRIDILPKLYANNPTMLKEFFETYSKKLHLMKKNINKPYFARIDFISDEENKLEKLYIGKVGVVDEDNNNITIDWRAPISSIYYDSNIGRTSYKSWENVYSGTLLLKRQYDIENGILKDFHDVDLVSNDDLLKPYLSTNMDNRLKNIVSTIQKEQNSIIREPIMKNIIVQGVAGSGKTTVALHRIAYLVYNYRESINPNQYLVIGPNKFFINYISDVLPDLEVDDVRQLTYGELCTEFLKENINLIDDTNKIIISSENKEEFFYEKFKVSMNFKEMLDKFIKTIDENIILGKGIELKGYEVVPNYIIKDIYFSIEESVVYDNIKKKIDRTNLMLSKYISDNVDEIILNVKQQYKNKNTNTNFKESDNLEFIEKEVKSGCKNILKKYFSNIFPNIINLYISFLENLNEYVDENLFSNIKDNLRQNIINVKSRKVEFEDLSALIYLKCKIFGADSYDKYKQVALDEAQDYGDFSFYALKYLLKNATFSIFGDLAQSIYSYRSIDDWQSVISDTFNNKCEINYLLKSYRTTTEIMNSANEITNYINLNIAEPVIRHGEKVKYINYIDGEEQIRIIKHILKSYDEKNYKSVAIICKNEEEATLINNELQKENIIVNNITDLDSKYNNGICIITGYFSKGLEFDGVIISNASEEKYNSNKTIDMKLLYVAMTRALHELNVLYSNHIVKPLQKLVEN